MQSEPGEPPQYKLNEQVSVNLWDRWEFTYNFEIDTITKLFAKL